MFFPVSKLFGFIFEPTNLVALALLLGLALSLARWRQTGRTIMAAATIVLIIMCFSPLSTLLVRKLEDRFPHPAENMTAPVGIIVLGGSINETISRARDEISMNAAASRLTAGVALARRFPSARLVFTGGSADIREHEPSEADGVERLWTSLGVPGSRMVFERKSRNTFENAILTKEMLVNDPLAPKPDQEWLLVTSAWHMPRSIGIFRHVGFNVKPYPVDYRTFGDGRDWKISLDTMSALERLDIAAHEWTGLMAYWMTGKTEVLFPRP